MPSGIDQRLCPFAVLLSVMAAISVFTLDGPAADFFSRKELPGDLRKLVNWAEIFAHGTGVLVITALVAILDREQRRFVPRLLYFAFGAGLANNLVKLLVTRLRPTAFFDLPEHEVAWHSFRGIPGILGAASHQSFPSGHTATAVGLAIVMSHLYPRGRWLWWLLAGLAAFQRVMERAHFVSDVLAGAAVACIVGALLSQRLLWDVGHPSVN